MNRPFLKRDARGSGGAIVEFLLIVPLLIILAIPVVDFARVLQANTIITNMAREGANLASRTHQQEQTIMDALAETAPPLQMRDKGMIRITRILAQREGGALRNVVISQHQWRGGAYNPPRGEWSCGDSGSFVGGDGSCLGIPTARSAPGISVMSGKLPEGEVVVLVEVFYHFSVWFGPKTMHFGYGVMDINPHLSAAAIF